MEALGSIDRRVEDSRRRTRRTNNRAHGLLESKSIVGWFMMKMEEGTLRTQFTAAGWDPFGSFHITMWLIANGSNKQTSKHA